MQPTLLLYYCVHRGGFQKHIKLSPLGDKGTEGTLGKNQVACAG